MTDSTHATPRFFGTWGMPADALRRAGTTNRYHLRDSETHDGPVVVFPRGVVAEGNPCIVHITADICLRRGFDDHRQRTRFVLRVVPVALDRLRENQGAVILTQEQPVHNACYRVGEDWWLSRVIDEPVEKYNPVAPPAVEFTAPAWKVTFRDA